MKIIFYFCFVAHAADIWKVFSPDPENEYLIQNAISKLVKGKTLIVVAHRLATIQKADQILVVENGKIVGCGRQEELLSECPLYQRLWSDYVSSADQVEGGTF